MPVTLALQRRQVDIVVVDAQPEDYAQLTTAEAARGVRFQFAGSADGAFRLGGSGLRSVWLVNARLPDGSGIELASALKVRDPGSIVCIVSDAYDPVEELAARMAGASMYLCKPTELSWLALAGTTKDRLGRCA